MRAITSLIVLLIWFNSYSQTTFPIDSLSKANSLGQQAIILKEEGKVIASENLTNEVNKILKTVLPPNKIYTYKFTKGISFSIDSESKSRYFIRLEENDISIHLWITRKSEYSNAKFVTSDALLSMLESAPEESIIMLKFQVIPAGYKSDTFIGGDGGGVITIHAKLLSVEVN